MSPTPRTDAIPADWAHWQEYRALAKELEHEINELRQELERHHIKD